MPIHKNFKDCIEINQKYLNAVMLLDTHNDDSLILDYYKELIAADTLIRGEGSPVEALYKTIFAKTVAPKIIPAIKNALATEQIPAFEISFEELDATRHALGLKTFGSPQDVLYTVKQRPILSTNQRPIFSTFSVF